MRSLIILCLILIPGGSYCQELSYRQLTVKDGLPGSIVYQALQDKNGFIWFATNQGVCRFDGRTFRNFSKEDGLPDNDIIKLYLDRFDNVWFVSFTGIAGVFYKGSVISFDSCKGVTALCDDLSKDSLVLVKGGPGILPGSYRLLQTPDKWLFAKAPVAKTIINSFNAPVLRASSAQGFNFYFSFRDEATNAIGITSKGAAKWHLFRSFWYTRSLPFDGVSFFSLTEHKNGIVFLGRDSVYYADINKLYPVVSLQDLGLNIYRDINFLFCENDSTLWLCTRSKGLLCIKQFLTSHKTITAFFKGSYCTSILKDQENGYWITTYNDGVYYLPNFSFHYITAYPAITDKNARCIRALNHQQLAAGMTDGHIISINYTTGGSRLLAWPGPEIKNNRIMDIGPASNDNIAVGTDRGVFLLNKQGNHGKKLGQMLAAKEIWVRPDKTIIAGFADRICLLNTATYTTREIFVKRIVCVTGLHQTCYWGTLNGVYKWINDSVSYLGHQYPALSGAINHLDIAPDSSLWASTPDGIVILKAGIITTIGKEQGLLSNMCKHVLFEEQTAWISTDRGISRMDYHWLGTRLSFSLSDITEGDGLRANDVNQAIVGGKYIWAATARGISFFPKEYISHSTRPPRINISRMVAGDKEVPPADTVVLAYPKNKLLIELSGISYQSGKQVRYEYRLRELDSSWSSLSTNSVEFPSLPYGRFSFEAIAIDRWGKRSVRPTSISIINNPPFWKTTWFVLCTYLAMGVLTGAGFYVFYRNRQRKREQEYQLKKKIHNLEMMALKAQMDPHFIFNCLNSIQYHILKTDNLSAYKYLHKFSTLIRQTLQHSSTSGIVLREEIQKLTLYLDLEKMRLEERMDYQINMPEDLLQQDDLYIPPMIIQPYVENAIKHGIASLRDRKGLIRIDIQQSGNYIDFFIEDNGPGIYSSGSRNNTSPHHTSMGTSITASRINAINAIHKNKIVLEITDKQVAGLPGSGTIIHLSFPIING